MLNYCKPYIRPYQRITAAELFFFDDENPDDTERALDIARRLTPKGKCISVFRPLYVMPADVQCVGHAPVDEYDGQTKMGTRCQLCHGFTPARNYGRECA